MDQVDKEKELFVFTDNYPFGMGESFLNSESVFLSKQFGTVHYFPLWKNGEMRQLPSGSVVEKPLLNFNPKGNVKLIIKGLFCLSPFFFAVPVFFQEKAWKSKKRFWDFMTSWLLIRAAYASLHINPQKKTVLYSYWGDRAALLLPLLKKKFDVVTVARFHGTDLYEEACQGYKPFRKWLFMALDMAAPISENGERYLREHYGKDAPRRIKVCRLGVFDHGLNPSDGGPVFQIVSCSNLVSVKRVTLLAKAIGTLDIKVSWLHMGDGPLRSEVEAVISSFPDHVEGTLLGAIPNEEVMTYYKEHHIDIFVNVSESEGIPVSIMEAFSFGIPVMATNVGGVYEIVDDTVGKLLSKDITPQQLAEFITEFYSNPYRQTIRDNARQRWMTMSDATRNYTDFCRMLEELAK
ncbi:MAG: glycosyltransferase [Bacteroidales bacterium]|nr:glycosyltransferase [Bacteroidales bacterium]